MIAGLGIFYGSRAMLAAELSAERALEAGATYAMPLLESVDGRRPTEARVRAACAALQARGVSPVPYTFASRSRMVASIKRAATIVQGGDLVLDIEPHGTDDWDQQSVDRACRLASDLGYRVHITIFDRPLWRQIKWPAAVDTVILQVYNTAADRKMLETRIARYSALFHRVIPAVGTWLGIPARLRADLENVRPYADRAGALAVWSLESTSAADRAVLRSRNS